jgi:hypothetical protein
MKEKQVTTATQENTNQSKRRNNRELCPAHHRTTINQTAERLQKTQVTMRLRHAILLQVTVINQYSFSHCCELCMPDFSKAINYLFIVPKRFKSRLYSKISKNYMLSTNRVIAGRDLHSTKKGQL